MLVHNSFILEERDLCKSPPSKKQITTLTENRIHGPVAQLGRCDMAESDRLISALF